LNVDVQSEKGPSTFIIHYLLAEYMREFIDMSNSS